MPERGGSHPCSQPQGAFHRDLLAQPGCLFLCIPLLRMRCCFSLLCCLALLLTLSQKQSALARLERICAGAQSVCRDGPCPRLPVILGWAGRMRP